MSQGDMVPIALVPLNSTKLDYVVSLLWLGNQLTGDEASDGDIADVLEDCGIEADQPNMSLVRARLTR